MNTLNKKICAITVGAIAFLCGACHSIESWENDTLGNFDALWTILDEHYCFFEEKDIDWEETGRRYRAKVNKGMDEKELFEVCAAMLDELKDGHTNLISWFNVSYYRKWWSDYPQNFDWRLIQEHYLNFDYTSGNGMSYKTLADGQVGYVYFSSFAYGISHSFVNEMLLSMKDCKGLILDIRDNGGGNLTSADDLLSHFINEKYLGGYISHKTGPGHSDFSEPYPYYVEPVYGVRWLKPVIVLTNRSTFSAANNFTAMAKGLEHVRIAGAHTGGGSGAPMSSEIPCGWSVRFSASPIYDADMKLTETGIAPSDGFAVEMDKEATLSGHDTILDFAIKTISNIQESKPEKIIRAAE